MGLFGKIKNIFYDEEIIEVPEETVKIEERPKIEEVKSIRREEVISRPKEEVKPVTPIYTERELFKTQPVNTFKFPMVDEEDEIKPTRASRSMSYEEPKRREKEPPRENKYADLFKNKTNTKEPEKKPERIFKPSPVISPVYGVLDKNYTKEEIIERQESNKSFNRVTEPKEMNYDAVRRKAYGTLEDELENTLTKLSEKTIETETDIKNDTKSIEDLLNEIEGNKSMSIGEIEEKIKDKMEDEEESKNVKEEDYLSKISEEAFSSEESEEGVSDKTLEHDLFNLIDSMYEEKKGE